MKIRVTSRRKGFTLIELLTVIAVIGVLASILIPTVGAARKAANKAKTRAQFVGYANAIQQFKTMYGYWPGLFTSEGGTYTLNGTGNTTNFVEALTGRNISSGNPAAVWGNRRAAPFYSFAEDEFDPDSTADQLVDAFGNPNINIRVDFNNDGRVDGVPDPEGSGTMNPGPRVKVAVWNDISAYPDGEEVFSYE